MVHKSRQSFGLEEVIVHPWGTSWLLVSFVILHVGRYGISEIHVCTQPGWSCVDCHPSMSWWLCHSLPHPCLCPFRIICCPVSASFYPGTMLPSFPWILDCLMWGLDKKSEDWSRKQWEFSFLLLPWWSMAVHHGYPSWLPAFSPHWVLVSPLLPLALWDLETPSLPATVPLSASMSRADPFPRLLLC